MTGYSLKEISTRLNTGQIPQVTAGAGVYTKAESDTALALKPNNADLAMAIGNINSPLLDMPLKNSLAMKAGVGSATFTRASTATYIDRYGVLKTAAIDEPRFEKEGYLNEGASTNYTHYSETYTSWTESTALTITNDSAIYNPYGILGMPKAEVNTDALGPVIHGAVAYGIPVGIGDSITASGIFKAGNVSDIRFRFADSQGYLGDTICNITTGVRTGGGTLPIKIESLANGLYRVSVTYTATRANAGAYVQFIIAKNGAVSVSAGDYLYAGYFQTEKLPFATSYIPTTSATVTRSADSLLVTRSGNFPDAQSNAEGFTILFDYDTYGANTTSQYLWSIYPTYLNSVSCYINPSQAAIRSTIGTTYGAVSNILTNTTTSGRVVNIMSNSYLSTYIDGVLKDTDTNTFGELGSSLNIQQYFGIGRVTSSTSSNLYGHISNFRIYDKSLSAQEVALA